MEDLQRKELEDQLEAEAYFSGLYKTQVDRNGLINNTRSYAMLDFESDKENLLGKYLLIKL